MSWVHQEVSDGKSIPLLEAYGVVRSLSLAMHGGQAMVMPLLQLKEFDQYTTTHSMNVSVLTMALGEFLGMAPAAVRGFGLAGLLHDLGKVRIPKEILSKPGKLTPEERAVVEAHPADGARMILEGDEPLDLAAVVAYEHHRCHDGGGYPHVHYPRDCPPGEPPGARLRRLRRAPHPPAVPRCLVVDPGARVHRGARRRRVRSGDGGGVHRDDAALGRPDRDRAAGLRTRQPATCRAPRPATRRLRATMSPTISSPCPRAFSMNSRLASFPLAMTPAR